jgi:DNA-binding SARP family transcriptional activator
MRILGPLEAWEDDRACPLPAGRAQIVLSVLALHANQVVSQERLVAAAWGAAAPATARTQVQGMVSALRRRLRTATGPPGSRIIATCGSGYRLDLEPDQLDLQLFHQLLDRARDAGACGNHHAAANALRRALALWRGPAFDGLHSDFLDLERARLERLRLCAIEECAREQLELGRTTEVIGDLERAADANPLHEGVTELLMLAYYRSGRQADALAAYHAIRRCLVDELGVEPGRNLHLLHQRFLTADPALDTATAAGTPQPPHPVPAGGAARAGSPPAAGPAQLPPDLTDFVGRTDEVQRLRSLLDPALRPAGTGAALTIAAIVGMGGVGKTTLATHVAHQVRDRFPDGQLYVDFGGSGPTRRSAPAVLRRLLGDLGVPRGDIPDEIGAVTALYRSMLADRRVLILLDDVACAAQVRPLLPGTGSSAVLTTSRSRLAGVAGAVRLDLGVLPEKDGRSLFAAVAGAGRVAPDPRALDEVLTVCAGLPLAIRIVAARLATHPTRTLRDLADRLRDPCRILDEVEADDLSLRATFDGSYSTLADSCAPLDRAAARAFRLLGTWGHPSITLPAASVLLGQPAAAAEAQLERLVEAHLLQCAADRYHLHRLVGVYAREAAGLTP